MEIHGPDPRDPSTTYVIQGWVGKCAMCGLMHYLRSGYAIYWTITGHLRGWQGLGPDAEWCRAGCRGERPRVTVQPLEQLDDQKAFIAAFAIGGDAAVDAMMPEQGRSTYVSVRSLSWTHLTEESPP